MSVMAIEKHPLYSRVRDFITSRHLLDGIEHLDIALSGGADSVCLVAILSAMKSACTLRAHHIRHHLRNNDGVDAEVARSVCEKLGIEFIQTELDWSDNGIPQANVEEEARKKRYSAFFQVLEDKSVSGIALAHHGDENLETAIWRLGRGCGLEGFGMSPIAERNGIRLIRPLLMVSKAEIYEFLGDIGLEWAEDPTNQSNKYRRNRIRHEILPLLKSESMSDDCLFRSLVQMRNDAESLSSLADSFVKMHPVKNGGWFCSWTDWLMLSESAKAQVLRHAVRDVVPNHCPTSAWIVRTLEMLSQQKQTFRQTEDGVVFAGWSHGGVMVWSESQNISMSEIEIAIPCSDVRIWNFCDLTAFSSMPDVDLKNTTSLFHVDALAVTEKLTIRPAETFCDVRNSIGNIIRLREALRSQGVPDMWRRHWPVLCSGMKPLWVLGGMRTFDAVPAKSGRKALTFSVRWC